MTELLQVMAQVLVATMMFSFQAYSQEPRTDFRIDCGATNKAPLAHEPSIYWIPDGNYINTGQNHLFTYSNNFSTMNSLRYFPNGNKSCYNLRFYLSESDEKLLFRAGFYYGNYDGLSKPPSFNVEVDGNLWKTVTTNSTSSEDEAIYHGMIYRITGDTSTVCLVRTSDDDIPFISSLEFTRLYYYGTDQYYRLMENHTALMLHSRIDYGANKSIGELVNQDDRSNRIWKPTELKQYNNIVSDYLLRGSDDTENRPPNIILLTAIQGKNLSDSIIIPLDFLPQTAIISYLVFYFRDPISRYPQLPIGKFDLSLNSLKLGTVELDPRQEDPSVVMSFYPVYVNGSANVTISAAEDSKLPSLLSAMEVFSVVNMTYVPNSGQLPN